MLAALDRAVDVSSAVRANARAFQWRGRRLALAYDRCRVVPLLLGLLQLGLLLLGLVMPGLLLLVMLLLGLLLVGLLLLLLLVMLLLLLLLHWPLL